MTTVNARQELIDYLRTPAIEVEVDCIKWWAVSLMVEVITFFIVPDRNPSNTSKTTPSLLPWQRTFSRCPQNPQTPSGSVL